MPPRSLIFWTLSLDHVSQVAAAMLPNGLRCAHAAVLPSIAIGNPVMAFKIGFSYAQSLLGPTAPHSNATSDRTAVTARTTAANVRGIIFCSASTIAVLPKPQAESPAQ